MAGEDARDEHVRWHDEAIDILDAGEPAGDLGAVDHAIRLFSRAVRAAGEHPARPFYLSHLGTAWVARYRIAGRGSDLDHAVTAARQATVLTVSRLEDQAGHRANLAAALLARFEHAGQGRDLAEAETAGREAAERATAALGLLASVPPPRRDPQAAAWTRHTAALCLDILGAVLAHRCEQLSDPAAADEAVRACRQAVRLTPRGHPGRPARQSNLAAALAHRYEHTLDGADLAEATGALREGLATARAGQPGRVLCLAQLAIVHAYAFDDSGDMACLAQAISTGREAVAATAGNPAGRALCRSNLGSALRRRYLQTGDLPALDEAISVLRLATAATPAGHARLPGYLSNLGTALRARFVALGAAADIQESADVLRRAVAATGPGHRSRAGFLANLGDSLTSLGRQSGQPGPLAEAVTVLTEALGQAGDGHPQRAACLSALGAADLAACDVLGDSAALDRAITRFREAAAAAPHSHPRRAEFLAQLAGVLRRRAELAAAPAGRDAVRIPAAGAITAAKSAVAIAGAPPRTRALAAVEWGLAAAAVSDPPEAVAGFAAAVGLLDEIAWRGLRRTDAERELARFSGLASGAAAWAIAAGQPERAVELLEQGRGVLLAQLLAARAPHDDLASADAGLAARIAGIDRRLAGLPDRSQQPAPGSGRLADLRAALARERAQLVETARQLPGCPDFLRPPAFERLCRAADRGPVVILNVSPYRCDALIVTPRGVQVVPLPELTGEEAGRHASAFVDALLAFQREGGDQETAGRTITGTLAWLWRILQPLLPHLLAACGGRPQPQVWWCPTGPLTFLPVHAAGCPGTGEALIERVVSSYTPTLRALLRAREPATGAQPGAAPLAVALSDTPGQQYLYFAEHEADLFAARFPGARQLRGPQATVAETRRALGSGPPWTHFSCHGAQDMVNPSAGGVFLYDGRLTIGEIARLRLGSARLAFLSACETSRGGALLADEAITLATAFQLAGFSHVIGTLWFINDLHSRDLARQVYRELAGSGTGEADAGLTAAALHRAVLALREEAPGKPWVWAPYVHLGA